MAAPSQPLTLHDIHLQNHQKEMDYGQEFKRIFCASLHPYIHLVFGFELLQFEADFFPELAPGASLADAVEQRFGSKAVTLIILLIGAPVSRDSRETNVNGCFTGKEDLCLSESDSTGA